MCNSKIKQNKTRKVHLEIQDIKIKKTDLRKYEVWLTVESGKNSVTKGIKIGGLKGNKL